MAGNQYMTGRRKYTRPQGVLFSENAGALNLNYWAPIGYEVGTNPALITDESLANQFIILSDDGRSAMDFSPTRIENRQRTINGRMRSYHIADKMTLSISWDMLPSRAYSELANFNPTTGKSSNTTTPYTTDGGAGGVEILDWYNNHPDSFWVFLSYDNYKELGHDGPTPTSSNNMLLYNEVLEMFISDFSYSVVKRGGSTHDFWNVSITLEEV